MASLAYFNGRFMPESELRLSFADAGFVFGATVTDFCRTYNHALFRWPDHLARLRRDAAACHIPLLQSDSEITTAAEQLIAARSMDIESSDDLALITFATPGPLGYMTGETKNGPPTLGMHCFPIPVERYRRFFTEGVELEFAGILGSHSGIVPLNVKHRSRMAWWLAGKKVAAGRVALLEDFDGIGADTAIGAVVAVVGETVYASPESSVLDSVSLKVLEELCDQLGLGFQRHPSPFSRLQGLKRDGELGAFRKSIGEAALVGSAFGIAGIRRVFWPGNEWQFEWPGPITQKLQAAWSRLAGE